MNIYSARIAVEVHNLDLLTSLRRFKAIHYTLLARNAQRNTAVRTYVRTYRAIGSCAWLRRFKGFVVCICEYGIMFASSLSVEGGSQRALVGSFVFLQVVSSFVLVGDRERAPLSFT